MAIDIEEVAAHVVDAAVKLHVRLGPGLLESVYARLLAAELERRGLRVDRQLQIPFEFDGLRFERGLRLDMLVDEQVVVELKSREKLAPVHYKQVLTYLRLTDRRIGFLINFGCATLKEGLHRIVNGYHPTASSRLTVNRPADPGSHPE